jgi:hypothetical protein
VRRQSIPACAPLTPVSVPSYARAPSREAVGCRRKVRHLSHCLFLIGGYPMIVIVDDRETVNGGWTDGFAEVEFADRGCGTMGFGSGSAGHPRDVCRRRYEAATTEPSFLGQLHQRGCFEFLASCAHPMRSAILNWTCDTLSASAKSLQPSPMCVNMPQTPSSSNLCQL